MNREAVIEFVLEHYKAENHGRVDYDEFCEGLDRVKLSDSMDEGAKRAAFSAIDRDGGGKVLFNEFCLWVRKKKLDLYNNPAGKYAASYGSRTPRGGRR